MTSRANLRGTDPKKVSGELFALTYGALVAQILKVSCFFCCHCQIEAFEDEASFKCHNQWEREYGN